MDSPEALLSESAPLILYGAGRRAARELDALRRKGMNPVCFCDADPNKWGTRHLGLSVLGPDGVKRAYPRFRIHIALAEPLRYAAQKQLVEEGVFPKGAIVNYVEASERKSCALLESHLVLSLNNLYYCCDMGCMRNAPPSIPMGASIAETMEEFLATRDRLIRDNQKSGMATSCSGCPELKDGIYPDKQKIRFVGYGIPRCCQFSCIYCGKHRDVASDPEARKQLESFDFREFMDYLRQNDLMAPAPLVSLAGGEITILPDRDSLLDAVKGIPTAILSNGAIYNERIAEKICEPGSYLFLSLDAGTRETFRRVKGVDLFDQVVANLRRYRDKGGNVELKYIVIPENLDDADLTGFVGLCADLGVRQATVVSDLLSASVRGSEPVLKAVVRLIRLLRRGGLEVFYEPYFEERNREIIKAGLVEDDSVVMA